jgi:hypothetical protein
MHQRVQRRDYIGDGVNFAGVLKYVCKGAEFKSRAKKQKHLNGSKKSGNVKKKGNLLV